jgi:hypothetical protein
LVFPKTTDNIGCFGRIAWTRPDAGGHGFLSGVSVESWHGIVQGSESWKGLKGVRRHHDRRQKPR